ncbi:LOW QUALITY PROTEIN: interferon-induced protein with tetratricopeptide repeats 1-like [Lycodopsis pacificus]
MGFIRDVPPPPIAVRCLSQLSRLVSSRESGGQWDGRISPNFENQTQTVPISLRYPSQPKRRIAAQSQTTLLSKLEALQCHFTWALVPKTNFLRLSDKLVDIGTEEGNSWLGHIYNLRGFVQYKLGFPEDAQSFFNKAAEAFRQMRKADDGPWLVVNYGNLAWLHHHLGDQAESEAYLSKVEALMKKYPSPSQDELHAEIYAEKAWTLMQFSTDRKLVADYFQKAIRMQPDMVEWNTSHILYSKTDDVLEKMRVAKEQDPENLSLAVYYLAQHAENGERVEDEARELAKKVLRNPVSNYSGWNTILRIYSHYVSIDEAIDLAEEALENHPDVRYLKRCATLYYKWKIILSSDSRPKQSMIDRAISLHEEVISHYPHSSFVKKVDLANIYAKSNHGQTKAEQMYQELLESDLEPADKQLLYNNYAKYLYFDRQDQNKSIKYHMKAAEIPHQSYFRRNSIKNLKIKNTRRDSMWREIELFLENLQKP